MIQTFDIFLCRTQLKKAYSNIILKPVQQNYFILLLLSVDFIDKLKTV